MKKISIITLALMLLTGMMFAQGTTPKHKNMQVPPNASQNPNLKDRLVPDDAPMPMLEMLNLSKDQLAKFQDLRLNHQKKMNTLQAEVENLRLDIQKALRAEKYADAKKLNDTLFNKMKEMANARIDHMQAMLKELTAEQKEMAREHFMMMGMGGPGKGHMMGAGKGHMMGRGKGMGCMGQGQMHMQRQQGDCHGQGQMQKPKGDCQGEGMQKMHGQKNKMQDCNGCDDKQDMPRPKNPNKPDTQIEK